MSNLVHPTVLDVFKFFEFFHKFLKINKDLRYEIKYLEVY